MSRHRAHDRAVSDLGSGMVGGPAAALVLARSDRTSVVVEQATARRDRSLLFAGTLCMQEVLHYSALQTGAAWLAASVTSMMMAGLSQALVTRIGPKLVMAFGMTLIGSGILWTTQAPVHAKFLANLAGPFVVAGPGT